MQAITTIGLDIAKSVFQVHGVDAEGRIVLRHQLKRARVLAFSESCRLASWAWRPAPHLIMGRARCRCSATVRLMPPVGEWAAEPSAIGWEQSTGWAPDPYALEALPASPAASAWDAPAASWEAALTPPDPLVALPAPDAEPLSSQSEIDAFVQAIHDTAPAAIEGEPVADYDVAALPPPEK